MLTELKTKDDFYETRVSNQVRCGIAKQVHKQTPISLSFWRLLRGQIWSQVWNRIRQRLLMEKI